jgi:hypothetical protein
MLEGGRGRIERREDEGGGRGRREGGREGGGGGGRGTHITSHFGL